MELERLTKIVAQIEYPRNDELKIAILLRGEDHFLQVRFPADCIDDGSAGLVSGRKWLLSPHMTESEVVATALMAILAAEEHEVREHFMYKGQRVFGPHLNVAWMAEQLQLFPDEVIDVREEPA